MALDLLSEARDYYLKLPLYRKIEVTDDNRPLVTYIFRCQIKLDMYCPQCERETTFDTEGLHPYAKEVAKIEWKDLCTEKLSVKKFTCLRCGYNAFFCSLLESIHTFQDDPPYIRCTAILRKVGQHPSLADMAEADLKKYSKVLGRIRGADLNRAVGLAANGVGIGSFVYLRRIFESLIEEAHQTAKEAPDWNEEAYSGMRVDEKIKVLGSYLPAFLLENRALYGILSKGIHELSESECLEIFPVVRVGIELILDEKIEAVERQQKIDSAKKTISSTHQKLTSKE